MYGKKEAVIVGDTEKHIPDIAKGVTQLKVGTSPPHR